MWEAIVFDGDDTLWETERLYDEARQDARLIVEGAGLDGARWEALEREIDVTNVARLGHSPTRFPTSCVEAYTALCRELGQPPDAQIAEQIRVAGGSVFERLAPPLANSSTVLTELRAHGLKLALMTKGDEAVQLARLDQSGLADLFDTVEIVGEKTPEAIIALLARLGTDPSAAVSVGNSIRSDVLPALAAGVQPVWIDAHVWEYERQHAELDDADVIQLADLGLLVNAILH